MFQKLTLTLLIFTVLSFNLKAQLWVDKMQNPNENFYSIQQEFKAYWQGRPYEKGKGYKAFKRWEWFAETRVYPTGDVRLASPSKAYEEFQKYLVANPVAAQKIQSSTSTASTGNWTALGPFGSPVGGDAGRVTFIRFHPTNSNTIYLGTGAGGMWVSTNGGTSWMTNTNSLAVLGCSDLAIDPTTPTTMYLATGDIDAGDTYATGVLKSTDGGVTWSQTALTFSVSQQRRIGRLLINPLNPNILFAATSNGIYRTNNGGSSWAQIKTGGFKDMEYRPGDTSTVYAATTAAFYKTTTGGNTSASFVAISSGIPVGGNRVCISVTPADPNYVYVLNSASDNSFGGVYRSINSGTSFTTMSTTPNIFGWQFDGSDTGGQGWYDIACGVSPTNKNEIVCGGVNSWKSTDGGVNWNLQTHWTGGGAPYVHADLHVVEYQSGSKLFMGTDGGVAVSTNTGTTWTTTNGTMNIAQSYRIGQSATTANYIISGHQDNGTNLLNGTTWSQVYGGDGADCFVDWSNNANLVESYIQGDFHRSSNSGGSWTAISTGLAGTAAWVAPIIQDPNVSTTYYCGYQQVYKSLNKGTTWTQMGTISGSAQFLYIAAAPSNSLVLYASTATTLYKTTNGGTSWTSVTTGLPTGSAQITQMAVDNTNSNNVFVTLSGYSAGNKVFYSTNGGTAWTNISAGLPNLPANCVIYQKNTNSAIYVGTDVGIYYKDASMASFTPYMTGLPNVVVNDLEIFYPTNKLRAGTYGRGVWESDLYSDPLSPPTAVFATSSPSLCINAPAVLSDQSSNTPTAWSWTLTGASPATSSVKNPTVSYNATGTYTVSLTSSNANGASTVYSNTVSVVASPTISLTSATICNSSPVSLSASGASTYNWSNGVNNVSISVNPSVTTVYTCTGSIAGCVSIASTTVSVGSAPPTPTITQSGAILSSSSASGNQWYFNGTAISGATAQTYTTTQDGFYSVWVTTTLGCQSSSNSVNISSVGFEELTFVNSIIISPNPAKDVLFVNTNAKEVKSLAFIIYAVNGQLVKQGRVTLNAGKETISITDLAKGVYEINFTADKHSSSLKFIKE